MVIEPKCNTSLFGASLFSLQMLLVVGTVAVAFALYYILDYYTGEKPLRMNQISIKN